MTDTVVMTVGSTTTVVDRAAAGDEHAFAQLIDEHHEPMVRAAYVVVGDAELAREAAQSAWTIAWRRLSTVRQPDRVRSWLVAICANEARRAVRRRKRRDLIELTSAPPAPASVDPTEAIDLVDLERALDRLKPDERSLLAMRYVVGLDSTEIADRLGMSPSGVRSRLARLVERLRTELDDA